MNLAVIAVAVFVATVYQNYVKSTDERALAQVFQKASIPGYVVVTKVIDGDTFEIASGEHVRLIGIDTPESRVNPKARRDSDRTGEDILTIVSRGKEATNFTKQLVEGKSVRLEFDVGKRDKYDRLLAYVYLEDGTFVNEVIIREGYASPLTIPPNVKYADKFLKLYDEARRLERGLWRTARETL